MTKLTLIINFVLLSTMILAQEKLNVKFKDAVPVLNLGTFHMGETTDASKVEFDEHNEDNVKEIHEIAKKLAAFKPTILIVESLLKNQDNLEQSYQKYLHQPDMKFERPDEIELLAFEIGRLAGTQRIYGIDYKEEYNYDLFNSLKNKVDATTFPAYYKMMQNHESEYIKKLDRKPTIQDMLIGTNQPEYLDFLINANADLLTYVSTKGKAEGADEAAKFYHRNLVIFSNLNQIEVTEKDRIFILMGATHTAFLKELMKRSPKYILYDVFDYLKD
ncbi:DUF5694 domain-containing protein [Sphingobacterium faecium]|uniref:DUF5694 domain-containing protein n=1 Tax=Sphingobacterium faecium TaxID=34087 RepID=UPI0024688AC6|nr:DUF5694 domain-containing protein [Sphingobacterium faecium]MDH5827538.1 DUF5694 domain-containing protein [Sphingobacterium faecium]